MSGIPILAIAYGLATIANFLLSVTVGRALGADALGVLVLAVAVARISYAASDLGIGSHMTRGLARDRTQAATLFGLFLAFRMALVPVAMVVAGAFGVPHGFEAALLFALVALAQGMLSLQNLYEGLLLSHERQRAAAALTVLTSVGIAASCGIWYAARATLGTFGIGYAVASAVGVCAWAYWSRSRLGIRPQVRLDLAALRAELRTSWPIGASVLLGIAALRAPVVVLGTFRTTTDVGAFSSVDMLVTATGILQVAVSNALFPRLAAAYANDRRKFRELFWKSNAALAAVGVAVAIFLTAFGPRMLAMVFPSKDFARVAPLMAVFGWSTPCLLLAHHNILVFAASDRERLNLRFMVAWCAIIAACQLALVPAFGLVGAAWGLLLGRLVGLAVLFAFLFASSILTRRS